MPCEVYVFLVAFFCLQCSQWDLGGVADLKQVGSDSECFDVARAVGTVTMTRTNHTLVCVPEIFVEPEREAPSPFVTHATTLRTL